MADLHSLLLVLLAMSKDIVQCYSLFCWKIILCILYRN